MSAWRVTSWDRALARGTITSSVGTLPFDASVADVDHFHVGEEVEVSLQPAGASWVVTRIAPVSWRPPGSPPPRADLQPTIEKVRLLVRDRTLCLRGLEDDELLVIDVLPESYEDEHTLVFGGCVFVQMPPELRDCASVSAFAGDDFGRAHPELSRHWPVLGPERTVFRFEPREFGQCAGYVVALALTVRTRPSRMGG